MCGSESKGLLTNRLSQSLFQNRQSSWNCTTHSESWCFVNYDPYRGREVVGEGIHLPMQWRQHFFCYGLLVGTSLIIILLTVLIQIPNYKKLRKSEHCTKYFSRFFAILSAFIALLTWLTVWYFDGHYSVCKRSTWEGDWTENSLRSSFKWCKPTEGNKTFIELQEKNSARWSIDSQVWKPAV